MNQADSDQDILPSATVEPAAPTAPVSALQGAPQAVKRSMPMALSVLLGIAGAVLLSWFFSQLVWFILLLYLSFIFATILDPPVTWLADKHLGRGISASLIMAGAFVLIVVSIYLLSGYFYSQMHLISGGVSSFPDRINNWIAQFRQSHHELDGSLKDFDAHKITGRFVNPQQLPALLFGVFHNASVGLEVLTWILVFFFVTLYMTISGADYARGLRRLIPRAHRLEATHVFSEICQAHRGWFFANACNITTSSILSCMGLWLLHVPAAFVLGIIAGLGELVPNVGPGIMAIPALLVALVVNPEHFFYVLAMFSAVWIIQGYGITPMVMKYGVELPPLVIIVSVLVMGTLFGVLGILVAIPLTADLVVLWNYANSVMQKDDTDYDTVNGTPSFHRRSPPAPPVSGSGMSGNQQLPGRESPPQPPHGFLERVRRRTPV